MLLENFKKHTLHFLKFAFPICSGTTIAQIAALLSVLLMTRIYTPQQFGEFSIVMALAGFLGSIACFSFENALILNKVKSNSKIIFILCIFLAAIFSFTVLLILNLLDFFLPVLQSNEIFRNKTFISIYVFIYGTYTAVTSVNFKLQNNKQIGLAKATEPIIHHGLVILLGLLGYGLNGLFAASIAGVLIGLIMLIISAKKLFINLNYYKISFKKIKEIIYEFRSLPQFYFFTNILINFNLTALIIAFSFIYDNWEVGLLAFALRILRTPYFVTKPLTNLFLSMISSAKNIREIMTIYTNILLKLIGISIITIIVFQFIPESFIDLLFGNNWIGITNILKLCVIFITLELIQNIMMSIYLKINYQKLQLLLCSAHTIIFLLTTIFIINQRVGSMYDALKIITFVNSIMLGIQLLLPLIIKRSKKYV